ncbi:MAG: Asp-tRNA(Asn)/Glu-tRNA(Gln) amidotransferase subunit GatC [Alphaproteobacteria bacterium]|nr:Asp-tRNA(Asn)/Glu-tRNA(Gln) amidotransferase subunit GatC [Alphaproteobacteria bacterium SS10]
MSIDQNTVARIARLARIDVPEEKLAPMADELGNILKFVEQLAEVDTDGVEPMTSVVAMEAPQREDVVNDGDAREAVLANAPEAVEGFYVVPKVVE